MSASSPPTVESRPWALRASTESAGSLAETWTLGSLLVAVLAWTFVASSGPIQWMDNGYLLFLAARTDYFTESLSATSHPLYHFLTVALYKLFGLYAVAYFNSLLMIPIAYVVYRLSQGIGIEGPYVILAPIAVVLLHNVFWVSTKIEVYALHLLIVLTAYWIALDDGIAMKARWRIFLVGLLTGLAAATHQLTFIVLLPLYVYVVIRFRWAIVLVLPGFAVGIFSCYPAIVHQLSSGSGLVTVLRLFLTGSDGASTPGYEGAFLRFDKILKDKVYVALVFLSLCGIGLAGLLMITRTTKHQTLWSAATLDLLFAVSYGVTDRFTFFLPGAALYAVLGVALMHRWLARSRLAHCATLALILAHPLMLVGTFVLATSGLMSVSSQSTKMPYRNEIQYFLAPYIPDTSAHTFVLAYEQQVPRGAVVLSDYSPMGALISGQIAGHFLGRELIQCDEKRSSWPDTMYLVRKDYCDTVIEGYSAEPAAVGLVVSRLPLR